MKKRGDAVDPQDAATAKGRFINFVASGHGAGVRGRGTRSCFRAARFDDNDRLVERNFPRGGEERSRVPDRFHVDKNAFRVWFIAKMRQQIAPTDVEHGAGRDNRAEPQLFHEAPVENRGQQCAALAEEGHVAGTCYVLREGGIQTNQGIHEAEAIRPDQTCRAALQMLPDLIFKRHTLRSLFLEPCGNHDDCFRFGSDAFGDNLRHCGGRYHDHDEIDRFWHSVDRCETGEAADFRLTRIYRVDVALVVCEEISENGVSHTSRTVGSTDHSD